MSFALTTQQMRDETKDVTRRLGWLHLKPGEVVQPVRQCMGLRTGQKVERLGGAVVTVSTRRELLRRMVDEPVYGQIECRREGFPDMSPWDFVEMFCGSHRRCTPETVITRIEFLRVIL